MKAFHYDAENGLTYTNDKKPINAKLVIEIIKPICAAAVVIVSTVLLGLPGLAVSGGGLGFAWLIKKMVEI